MTHDNDSVVETLRAGTLRDDRLVAFARVVNATHAYALSSSVLPSAIWSFIGRDPGVAQALW